MKKQASDLLKTIRAKSLLCLLSGVLVMLLGTFLAVMFCGDAEKYIDQLLGVSKVGVSKKYETLKFLGIGMGGVLLALQALMSYKRAKALEDTVRLTEGGQWQERLKNAIEHLGHESEFVRRAGTHELYHLARYTEESQLHQLVLDILGDYIRQTAGEEG